MSITMTRNQFHMKANEAFNSAGGAVAAAYVETASHNAVAPAVQPPDGAGALQLHTKEVAKIVPGHATAPACICVLCKDAIIADTQRSPYTQTGICRWPQQVWHAGSGWQDRGFGGGRGLDAWGVLRDRCDAKRANLRVLSSNQPRCDDKPAGHRVAPV